MEYTRRRARRLIEQAIQLLDLDLRGFTVLTEVGSGNYAYTPLIPLMAGAKKVIAWTGDSRYGSAADNKQASLSIANELELDVSRLTFSLNERNRAHVQEADIITNSGFIRPLDGRLLADASSDTVVPLMYEAWELRKEDVDVEACTQRSIQVAGTWENHPDLKIFDGIGALAVKMAQEAGYEVHRNRVIIWSEDHFGEVAQRGFESSGAAWVRQTTSPEELLALAPQADFIFFCPYSEQRTLLGVDGIISLEELMRVAPDLGIVHLYGKIDHEWLVSKGVPVFPAQEGRASIMTRTLAHLGLMPVLYLQVAGFKVAESMKKKEAHDIVQPINY